jgi:hypothetical protein
MFILLEKVNFECPALTYHLGLCGVEWEVAKASDGMQRRREPKRFMDSKQSGKYLKCFPVFS